uniref:EF-hand-like domain n=1 Tax=Saccharum hybrid cultivar R570 TaxID=131158 RepID=A0A059Q1E3_9POAL|nr:EF-hand-like domain [Saccharum hybrid cultivar R570]
MPNRMTRSRHYKKPGRLIALTRHQPGSHRAQSTANSHFPLTRTRPKNTDDERGGPRREHGAELCGGRGAFNSSVDGRFAAAEMAGELMSLRVLEKHFGVDETVAAPEELGALYRGLFARFDRDGSGKVDRHEFRAEMKEVMLAVANGLGFLPVQMVVEEGSFLKVAVDRELGQLAKAA